MVKKTDSILSKDIRNLDLSPRSSKCLTRIGITTIGELIKFKETDLLRIKYFGHQSLIEVKTLLKKYNLKLMEIDTEPEESYVRCRSLQEWLAYAKTNVLDDWNTINLFKKKKHLEVFRRRYCQKEAESMRMIGQRLSVSPARVGQIAWRILAVLLRSLTHPYKVFIHNFISEFHKNKKLVAFKGNLAIIDSLEFRLFNFFLSRLDNTLTFDYKAKVWRENNNDLLNNIAQFLKEKLEPGDVLPGNQIDSIALEFILQHDFTHYNQEAVSNLFISYHFIKSRNNFFYKRIIKSKVLENFLSGYKEGIKKSEISAALGFKKIQIESHIQNSDKILGWGKGRVIHVENITFNKNDLVHIFSWTKNGIRKYKHLSVVSVFENNLVLCKKNTISNPGMLYTVLKKYSDTDALSFPKYPLILEKEPGKEDAPSTSFYDLFLNYFASQRGIVSKQQLSEYFVKERGYKEERINKAAEYCDNVIKYTKNSYVALETIGWTNTKSAALEKVLKKKYKRDVRAKRPFSFVDDLLEVEPLPLLENNISWQKPLLIELLTRMKCVRLMGKKKEVYTISGNKQGIKSEEDIMHYVLKHEFKGAANKTLFLKRLKEYKIASSLTRNECRSRLTVQGEEVFIKECPSRN